MARVDDKARFYLERAVPQLREFESKEIFSKDEIRTLVQKRTDFERLILSPGSQPADVLAYVAWEESLESLRAKRCRRLRIKQASSSHAGQARIFQTFERGVTRHPGSGLLWRRYLAYAAEVKATKRWRRIMTRALRMLPSDGELWVLAGRRAVQDGDMEAARGFFMRGCRFCTSDQTLWLEYARAEMEWLARLGRKTGIRVASVSASAPASVVSSYDEASVATLAAEGQRERRAEDGEEANVYEDGGGFMFDKDDEDEDDEGGDFSNVPILPKELVAPPQKKRPTVFSEEAVRKLAASPALEGGIPRAIFDVAQKQPFFGSDAAEAFFDLFALFVHSVPAQARIVAHVLAFMEAQYPADPATWNCRVKQPLLGLNPDAPAFPRALRTALVTVREALKKANNKAAFAAKTTVWIDVLLEREDLDAGLRSVLEDTKRKLERA